MIDFVSYQLSVIRFAPIVLTNLLQAEAQPIRLAEFNFYICTSS